MLAVGSLVYIALASVSSHYHAPGATLEEQATLGLVWVGVQSVFNATDTVGLLLLPIGVIVLGFVMRRAPSFGKSFGRLIVVLGVVAVVGMSIAVADPRSQIALFGIFLGAIIGQVIFPILLGWKVYSLSRVP
ncbi:MAG: hypothetical protein COB20_06875 [SAR86 cluster bacterium]|uniref:Uncharacterized protein n=1 Tax=SAR86 cluster bacterium TaxID=2030880 RepID=A0A2A4X7F0_9GAMM|nr:MAG: hypothetical protein COB20_06875 [SAR86 cluster bacterium]